MAEKLTESSPSWFLIGFRLQRGGKGMGYKNEIQEKKINPRVEMKTKISVPSALFFLCLFKRKQNYQHEPSLNP